MSQHTAGPWFVVQNGDKIDVHARIAPIGEDLREIGIARNLGSIHDARLIAAATTAPHECDDLTCSGAINKRKLDAFPELLEACEAFLEAQDSPAPRDLLTLAAIRASAAIAKATS